MPLHSILLKFLTLETALPGARHSTLSFTTPDTALSFGCQLNYTNLVGNVNESITACNGQAVLYPSCDHQVIGLPKKTHDVFPGQNIWVYFQPQEGGYVVHRFFPGNGFESLPNGFPPVPLI